MNLTGSLLSAPGVFLIVFCVGLFWVLSRLGWLSARKPWQVSVGWNQIPQEFRPHPALPPAPTEPLIRWLGHSGFVVRWANTVLLLDPNVSRHCTITRRVMELPASPSKLRHVDAALISHAHYDHLNLDTLVSIPGLRAVVLPPGSDAYLNAPRARHLVVIPLPQHQTIRIGSLVVCPVPASHNGSRYHPWRSRFQACGYVIRDASGQTIYFAGDTAFACDWSAIREAWHPSLAILPIGAYAPRRALQRHHMNPEEAVAAARALGVQRVIPCHMGTFCLSLDRPDQALPRFARAAAEVGLEWDMPMLLRDEELPLFNAGSEQQT